MAKIYDKLIVDVQQEVRSIITVTQRDTNSRYLDVYLKDNGLAIDVTGHQVRIYGKKADGKEFYNDGEITEAENGRCQFPLTSEALAVANDLTVQLILYRDNVEMLHSRPFTIHVKKSFLAEGAVESSNEYGALVVLYQNLHEAYELMMTMVENIGAPGVIAEGLSIDTMWEAWEYMSSYLKVELTEMLQNAMDNNSVDGVVRKIGDAGDTGGSQTTGTVMGKSNAILDMLNYYKKNELIIPKSETKQIRCPPTAATQEYGEIVFEYDKPIIFKALEIPGAPYDYACKLIVTFENDDESYSIEAGTSRSDMQNSRGYVFPSVLGAKRTSETRSSTVNVSLESVAYKSIITKRIRVRGYNESTVYSHNLNLTLYR